MQPAYSTKDLFDFLIGKSSLKQNIFQNTHATFQLFKQIIKELTEEYKTIDQSVNGTNIGFEFKEKGEFEIELKFGGDILLFAMHTNVFEFSRYHEVMKTQYIKEDRQRSYCGVINIYNFLADSIKYKRMNDLGYLIGRLFINKDSHYFVEGKREIGLLYNNFQHAVMDYNSAKQIVCQAIVYTLNFDLLTPPFDEVKMVRVFDMLSMQDNMKTRTGKRLGFKFQGDHDEIKE